MPELRTPDIPSSDLSPGPALSAPGASVSIAIAEGHEDHDFVVDRNAQAALSVTNSTLVVAIVRGTFMCLGMEPLANLPVWQSYPGI